MTQDLTCPRCVEAECEPVEGTPFVTCPACGHGFTPDQIEHMRKRAQNAKDKNEIREIYDESCRRREPGGGDDGLSMTWDYPVGDDSIVKQSGPGGSMIGSGRGQRGKKIEPSNTWLSVRELPQGTKSQEVMKAIEARLHGG